MEITVSFHGFTITNNNPHIIKAYIDGVPVTFWDLVDAWRKNNAILINSRRRHGGQPKEPGFWRTKDDGTHIFIEGPVMWFDAYSISKYFESSAKHSEWEDKLTNERKESITYYTGADYESLNNNLRENIPLTDEQSKNAERLDALIEDYELEEPICVYRGLPPHVMDNYLKEREKDKNKLFPNNAYTSTSCYGRAGIVNQEGTDLLMIYVPKGKGNGAYIGFQSKYPNQYEFLIRRGANMKYVKHDTINGRRVFYFVLK